MCSKPFFALCFVALHCSNVSVAVGIYRDMYVHVQCVYVCVSVCVCAGVRDVCRTAPKSQISHESSRKFASFIWPRISVCSLVCHIFAYPVTMQCGEAGV